MNKITTNGAINLKIDLIKKISDLMAKEEISISALDVKISSYAEKLNSKAKGKKKDLLLTVDGSILIKFNSIINKNQKLKINNPDYEPDEDDDEGLIDDLFDESNIPENDSDEDDEDEYD
jgi:hypothetical protein